MNSASVTVPADHEWIKFNKDQIGYYRVNYPVEEWKKFSNALISDLTQFSISDRGHLLNDAFSLADASQLDFNVALDLTVYLKNETEYVPWRVAVGKLYELKRLLYYSKYYRTYVVCKFSVPEALEKLLKKKKNVKNAIKYFSGIPEIRSTNCRTNLSKCGLERK